jgi:hypothetical protein
LRLQNVGPVPRPLAYSQYPGARTPEAWVRLVYSEAFKFADGAGARTFGKVSVWTCESRVLFQGGGIARCSILNRFYSQTGACST